MALDRSGVTNCIRDTLQADTATLYGSGKLVQTITSNPVLFDKAKVDRNNPYKIYLWSSPKSEETVRMQNSDDVYTLNYKIVGLNANVSKTIVNIDDIDEQMSVLIRQQMFGGDMFTSYYTDSNAQIIDASYDSSDLDVDFDNDRVVALCEGVITVTVNRWT